LIPSRCFGHAYVYVVVYELLVRRLVGGPLRRLKVESSGPPLAAGVGSALGLPRA